MAAYSFQDAQELLRAFSTLLEPHDALGQIDGIPAHVQGCEARHSQRLDAVGHALNPDPRRAAPPPLRRALSAYTSPSGASAMTSLAGP